MPPRAVGEQHVADDGERGDLGEQDAVADVPDPVGDAVVVLGQRPVEPVAQRGGQPAQRARPGGARGGAGGAAVAGPLVRSRSCDRPAAPPSLTRPHPSGGGRVAARTWRVPRRRPRVRMPAAAPARVGRRRWDDTRAWRTPGATRSRGMVLGAWDAFIEQAETVDLSRPSRLRRLAGARDLRAPGLLGRPHRHGRPDRLRPRRRRRRPPGRRRRQRPRHRRPPRRLPGGGPRRRCGATARRPPATSPRSRWSSTPRRRSRSSAGIPLLSVVLGQAYELAVHGLDLVSCGAAPPPPEVLQSGLAALADVTGGAGRVDGHQRRGHARDPRRRLGVRLRSATAGRCGGCPAGAFDGPAVEAPRGPAARGRVRADQPGAGRGPPQAQGARRRRPAPAGPDRAGGARASPAARSCSWPRGPSAAPAACSAGCSGGARRARRRRAARRRATSSTSRRRTRTASTGTSRDRRRRPLGEDAGRGADADLHERAGHQPERGRQRVGREPDRGEPRAVAEDDERHDRQQPPGEHREEPAVGHQAGRRAASRCPASRATAGRPRARLSPKAASPREQPAGEGDRDAGPNPATTPSSTETAERGTGASRTRATPRTIAGPRRSPGAVQPARGRRRRSAGRR